MIRGAWFRDDKTVTRTDIHLEYSDEIKTTSELWKAHDEFIGKFIKQFPCSIILEISEIGLCDELDDKSMALKKDFKREVGETLQHARMRYAFEWCNAMRGVWYPNVKAYSDTECDPDTGIVCNAIPACLLQILRESNELYLLDDMSKFERYYYESVH